MNLNYLKLRKQQLQVWVKMDLWSKKRPDTNKSLEYGQPALWPVLRRNKLIISVDYVQKHLSFLDILSTNPAETAEASEAMVTEALEEGIAKTLTSTERSGR